MAYHQFNVEEAEKFGVEKAILIYNMRFWLDKNRANKANIRGDYYWTYNSSKAFGLLFPYFKERSIRRWLLELEEGGFLLSDNYNERAYDNTKWYTIPSEFKLGQFGQGSGKRGQNSRPDGQTGQSSGQTGQPIPDDNTDSKPDVSVAVAPENKIILEKKREFQETIRPYIETYGREMCNAFYKHWCEATKNGKKIKWELEDTWEVNLRLAKWKEVADKIAEREAKFKKSGTNDPPTVASSPESYHQKPRTP